ncbi:MAG: DUF72 domain-containing protein [Chitinivibrionales bacterium]|nr:DUF72 domain-containing protein [Chitinivibrionales bacterium]
MSEKIMSEKNNKYHIGTSGWHYSHWKGPFYPPEISSGDMLAYYTQYFDTVEINNTFYKLPEPKTLKEWAAMVPDNFEFAVKASRYITHVKKLKDPRKPLRTFMRRVAVLKDKLGPILFQLPPAWNVNIQRLESFLDALPRGVACAFEFRNESWFNDTVLDLLDEHDASFCVYDIEGRTAPSEAVGPIGYLRLHGPGKKYEGSYTRKQLDRWAGTLQYWHAQGRSPYCYFDNDQNGYAPDNARAIKERMQH